jgi:hypothetical protein
MQPVADYYLGRPEFKGLAVQASYREPGGGLHFAFSPAAATLHAAVNHGLATMPQDVRRAVIGRWVTPPRRVVTRRRVLSDSGGAGVPAVPARVEGGIRRGIGSL